MTTLWRIAMDLVVERVIFTVIMHDRFLIFAADANERDVCGMDGLERAFNSSFNLFWLLWKDDSNLDFFPRPVLICPCMMFSVSIYDNICFECMPTYIYFVVFLRFSVIKRFGKKSFKMKISK